MAEFEQEVDKAKKELEQGLVPVTPEGTHAGGFLDDEYLGDLKAQAQEYGQKLQDAAVRARDYAGERLSVAGDKLKELQNKDPKEIVEDAKQYARENPGRTILVSAAVGVVIGLLLKGRR